MAAVRRAWVSLVMLGDTYVPGALVLGYSLKETRSRYPTAIMVTSDVSETARESLARVFDKVIEVPYISHPTRQFTSDRQIEAYNPWIDKSFTKWNCLGLSDFDEVIFIDSDIVVLENMDELFALKAPAACFSSPWQANLYPYVKTPRGVSRDVFIDLKHGERIDARDILYALTLHSIVGGGFLMKLPTGHLENFKTFLQKSPVYGAGYKCHSGSDEMSICEYFAHQGINWTHIHQRYAAIPWKPKWVNKDIKAYHYISRKPWDMDPEEWSDLKVWWQTVERMLTGIPELNQIFNPEKVSLLDMECAQYMLLNDVREMLMSLWSEIHGSPTAEIKVSLREDVDLGLNRWMLSMKELTVVPSSWSFLFSKVKPDDPLNVKLLEDLIRNRVFIESEAREAISRICRLIDRRLSRKPLRSGIKPQFDDKSITYGSRFKAQMTVRIKQLIDTYGIEQTIVMVLHHHLFSQKWKFPDKHVDILYEFGVRHEALSDLIDSGLWNKEKTFVHEDFPEINDGERWMMVLPDHESTNRKIIDRILLALPHHSTTIFLVLPKRFTIDSPYIVGSKSLGSMVYFILSTEKEALPFEMILKTV